jgi:hypothetical protein
MKLTNKKILIYCSVFAIILLGISVVWMKFEFPDPKNHSVDDHQLILNYLTLKFEVFKAIIIGYLVSVLGLIIPNILPEAKYEFQRKKEGRKIYSKAKTGIDYLPYELADLDKRMAREHIHNIHELKHLADIYIKDDAKITGWPYKKPYGAYEILMAYLDLIEDEKNSWDNLDLKSRSKKLLEMNLEIKEKSLSQP